MRSILGKSSRAAGARSAFPGQARGPGSGATVGRGADAARRGAGDALHPVEDVLADAGQGTALDQGGGPAQLQGGDAGSGDTEPPPRGAAVGYADREGAGGAREQGGGTKDTGGETRWHGRSRHRDTGAGEHDPGKRRVLGSGRSAGGLPATTPHVTDVAGGRPERWPDGPSAEGRLPNQLDANDAGWRQQAGRAARGPHDADVGGTRVPLRLGQRLGRRRPASGSPGRGRGRGSGADVEAGSFGDDGIGGLAPVATGPRTIPQAGVGGCGLAARGAGQDALGRGARVVAEGAVRGRGLDRHALEGVSGP
ncbi:hypothetical protein XA68_12915 [Ophiocordyceps unilateralis]|uniref:Uncharacterized protein n=1 Tax=Ophiocordyceps unilateralis TaxID=268505 RepID=A0A2A9PDQ2_OPHUN|nr:hypothetical protein XA68_12915 [Ophiocordyceps unilateralis]